MASELPPPEDWPAPRQTGNAKMLEGFIAGALSLRRDGPYHLEEISDRVVFMHENGNRYEVRALQISGVE